MYKKFFSLLLILLISVNVLFTSLVFLFDFLKTKSINYNTTSVVMINSSKHKNISESFIDICSNISNMFVECNKNDKTKPVINKKKINNTTVPTIFIDKIITNSAEQYKYRFHDVNFFTFFSSAEKYIIDKLSRTSDIFLLLLLQILIYLIVLNMCNYFNNFYLNMDKITLSLRCNFFIGEKNEKTFFS